MKISTNFKKFSIQKLLTDGKFLSVIIPTAHLHSRQGKEL